MPLLECRGLVRMFGMDVVLDGVDLLVERGQRIGLVGANGCGKTTLCRLITGQDEPDEGRIHLARGSRIGYLSQSPELDPHRSVRAEAMSVLAEISALHDAFEAATEAIGHAADEAGLQAALEEQSRLLAELESRHAFDAEQRLWATLGAFGLGTADLDRPVRTLSGGEKSRLALARLLMTGCDLLLLDEPTNHLDIQMTEWLEQFLAQYPGAVIIVSHDRWFLDNVCHGIAELEGGRITTFWFGEGDAKLPPPEDSEFAEAFAESQAERYGAYTHYTRVKAERRAAEWKAWREQQKELKRQEAWIRWKLNLRRGRHVREAESRQKRLDKVDRIDRPEDEPPVVALEFEPLQRGPTDVAHIEDCAFGYGREPLFEDVDLHVRRLQRVGIVGPNGCGKSSLLKLLRGELPPTAGSARLGSTAEVGYYHQEHLDLNLQETPVDAIRGVDAELPLPRIRGFLARFLFFGDDVFRPIGTFSGGERSRLVLARLMLRRPNVLLLDEPTNHLDIAGREVLEEALRAFGGTILVVSHDRYFLDRICGRLLRFEDGTATVFEGRYSAWEAARDEARRAADEAEAAARKQRHRDHVLRERSAREAKAQRLAAAGDGRSLAELEDQIQLAERELAELAEQFLDPAFYRDGRAVTAAQRRQAEARRELEELYAVWEALVEAGG